MEFGRLHLHGAGKSMLSANHVTRRIAAVLGLLLLVFVALKWWIARPRSISTEATRLTNDLADGNADALFDSASQRELDLTHLTRQSFRKMFDDLIWPRVRAFRPSGPSVVEVLSAGSAAAAYLPAKDRYGHVAEFALTAYTSNEGPKISLTGLLLEAWIFDNINAHGLAVSHDNLVHASSQGCAKDRKPLAELGIIGLYDPLHDQLVPWERMSPASSRDRRGSSRG